MLVLIAAAAALPFFVSDYRTFQFTQALVYAIVLMGLNILTGYNGQISLGHGAFYAVGAYTAAILMDRFGMPYWATIPMGGAVCLVFGFLFGLPALRLHGHYLALATFALAVAMPQILKYKLIEGWTGGVQGIVILKPDPPAGLPISQDKWLYFAHARDRRRAVRAGVEPDPQPGGACADGDTRPAHRRRGHGREHRVLQVAWPSGSARCTPASPARLSAIIVQFVAPDSFAGVLSINFLIGVVVGGLASISGAIWGALFIQFVPNFADQISKAAPWAIYGIFMIAFAYLMPTGVAGFLRMIWRKLTRRAG